MEPLRIANAQAFWGDDDGAAARLAARAPDLDYITLDYLAEVSMSILARQQEHDPSAGYARDFVNVVASLAPFWRQQRKFRVITNAGGLNPVAAATACAKVLREAGCRNMSIGVVTGDDVLPLLRKELEQNPRTDQYQHLETGEGLETIRESLATANAYLGGGPLAEALASDTDIVIAGRVADPSLTVAPCIAHFGWSLRDYQRIAGATVAGHLIECGTQVTGGISTDWLELPDEPIGFPIAEISEDGSCVITKPAGSGGRVDERTVKEQLLYEIGDPSRYLSPDATVSFLPLNVELIASDRVRVSCAAGEPPPSTYKVSATYRAGFRASGTLAIFGRDAITKARRCGRIVTRRLHDAGVEPEKILVESLGGGDIVPGVAGPDPRNLMETVLRISAFDERREIIERFTRQLMPLVTAGPQGTTGYAEGRPAVREVYGYWPTLVARELVRPTVQLMKV